MFRLRRPNLLENVFTQPGPIAARRPFSNVQLLPIMAAKHDYGHELLALAKLIGHYWRWPFAFFDWRFA